jgi:tRNA (guanine6-N2)-methyltransferase
VATDIDLDRPIRETVHLESLPGAVERLLQHCHDLGKPALEDIRLTFPDSVVLNLSGTLRAVAEFRMYSAFSIVLGDYEVNRRSGYAEALSALRRSASEGIVGLLAAPDRPVPVSFRVDPLPDRSEVRAALESALGWRNEPGAWQLNVVRRGNLLLAQVGALHTSKRFPPMRRVPASTTPVVAALLLQLAKPRQGDVVLDPCCGAGTLLVEAAETGLELRLIGSDLSQSALAAAARNRAALFPSGVLLRADASALPIRTGSVNRIVANLPFGKRVGSHAANVRLYPAFLAEFNRVLTTDGRAVLLTEDKNLFRQSVERTHNMRLIKEVKLSSGGLHPSAFVVERTRTARRSRKAQARAQGEDRER